jgi:hypothetical protein
MRIKVFCSTLIFFLQLIDVELERDSIDSSTGRPSFPELISIQPIVVEPSGNVRW